MVPAAAHSVLCRPELTPEERAAREARRSAALSNATRILTMAEMKALEGETEVSDALVKIAQAWDNVSY